VRGTSRAIVNADCVNVRQLMATTIIFIQRSRFGKRIYELRDSKLTISRNFGLKSSERTFNMQHMSPNFVRVRKRTPRLVYLPLAFAGLAGLLMRDLRFLPTLLYVLVVESGIVIVITSLWLAVRGIPSVEIVAFKNANNHLQFDLVKEEAQATEFEEFIVLLSNSIAGNLSEASKASQVTASVDKKTRVQYWWIGSLGLGFCAILLVLINKTLNDPSMVFLTFPCSVGGSVLCFYSFAAKERLRYLSICGAILSLAPIYVH
jgi:hypothetical protein